jgi:hypothetical protein
MAGFSTVAVARRFHRPVIPPAPANSKHGLTMIGGLFTSASPRRRLPVKSRQKHGTSKF